MSDKREDKVKYEPPKIANLKGEELTEDQLEDVSGGGDCSGGGCCSGDAELD